MKLLLYIIEVIICSALFAGSYRLLLRDGRFHQWNRFYILSATALSIIIPIIRIPIVITEMGTIFRIPFAIENAILFSPQMGQVEGIANIINGVQGASGKALIAAIWFIVFAFLFGRSILLFIRIIRLKRGAEKISVGSRKICGIDDDSAPFTFFGTIFWRKGIAIDTEEGHSILKHELAHVRLGHSWDKFLMEAVCCFFWMNPLFRYLQRELELVHEYAADSESVSNGDTERLSSIILCTLYPGNYRDFTSHFSRTSVKKRLVMVAGDDRTSMKSLRKIAAIFVLLIPLYAFSVKTELKSATSEFDEYMQYMPDSEANHFAYDEVAQFPGGEDAMRRFVHSNLVYPDSALNHNISGRIMVQLTIEKDGTVSNAKIVKGFDKSCEDEVLRVVSMMPKWEPFKLRGAPVRYKYSLFPIVFELR